LTRRLVGTYLVLAAILLVAFVVPLGLTFAESERSDLSARVERDAFTLASLARDSVAAPTPELRRELWTIARRYQRDTGGRVVLVDARGRLIADSDEPQGPGAPRSFASRPEVAQALAGEVATGERFSSTLGENLTVVAVPVASGGQVLGAVRITFPTDELDADTSRYWLLLAAATLVGIAAVGAIGFVLARTVTRPLQRLRQSAVALGRGELSTRVGEAPGPRELQDLAESFDAMAGRLERLVASQRDFAADASHQLRTPLAALRLRLENLREDAGPGERRDVDAALLEVERLSGIIDGLLILARAESPEPPLTRVAVAEVVADRAAAHEALAARRGVTLAASAEPASATAVPGAVDQMLDNLIDNAVKVSPRGERVTVTAARTAAGVEIHVVDRGPGMGEEERRHAFDRFWRSGATGRGGSGLGLAIVRRLAEACGGTAELRPADGGGLDAVVVLPSAPSAEVAPQVGDGRAAGGIEGEAPVDGAPDVTRQTPPGAHRRR
jgi:signal transduction histidine kinase